MKNSANTFQISEAVPEDYIMIDALAKSMDLDRQNLHAEQFVVVRKGNQILGFGRLLKHDGFCEIATLGVTEPFRKKGIGEVIVRKLSEKTREDIFLVTVIPAYFSKLGFSEVQEFSDVFLKKIEFCKCYHFSDEEIKVMKLVR